jgi:Family of unknown function (DUF5522)
MIIAESCSRLLNLILCFHFLVLLQMLIHASSCCPRHLCQLESCGRFAANCFTTAAGSGKVDASTSDRRHKLSADQQRLRDEFLRQEAEREAAVDHSRLTAAEQLIHARHAAAVARFHFTYDDPATGLRVMTRYRHYLRGSCCGSDCRHCIYQHENVAPPTADEDGRRRRKIFNSAFWTETSSPNDEGPEEFSR